MRFLLVLFSICHFTTSCSAVVSTASPNSAPSNQPPKPLETSPASIVLPPIPEKPSHLKALPVLTSPPSISAPSAIVLDALSGQVLMEKNAHQKREVASIQKILTSLVVIESGNLDQNLTVSSSDQKTVPARIYISRGERYTRRYLLKALLIKSGNDAARALARDHSGSYASFVQAMNSKARALGMNNSLFKNPSGLSANGQYSTAHDIAILSRYAYHNPLIKEAIRTKSMLFTYPNGKTRHLTNTNELLLKIPYCTGFKTGTTQAAGRCLVSSGELNGRTTIVVVLGAKSPTVLWKDSEALLRWSLEPPSQTP